MVVHVPFVPLDDGQIWQHAWHPESSHYVCPLLLQFQSSVDEATVNNPAWFSLIVFIKLYSSLRLYIYILFWKTHHSIWTLAPLAVHWKVYTINIWNQLPVTHWCGDLKNQSIQGGKAPANPSRVVAVAHLISLQETQERSRARVQSPDNIITSFRRASAPNIHKSLLLSIFQCSDKCIWESSFDSFSTALLERELTCGTNCGLEESPHTHKGGS